MTKSLTPTSKVTAAGLAGAVTTLVVFALGRWVGVDIPPEAAAGLTTLISFVLAWAKIETRPV